MTGPWPPAQALIGALQAIRGRRVVLYHSALTADTLPPLYECLIRLGRIDDLDLVLSTSGGTITGTRQVATLLRQFAGHLTILVPYRARSAGTLLCLGADQLVLGPLAEMGPIDSTMDSDGVPAPDAPGSISAEDIRAFRQLAEEWFGIDRPEDRLQVLALLATRIFPTALSSFYRFDKLVREVAAELLEWQLAGDEFRTQRQSIVDRLVSGYHSHDVVLSRRDVQALGLRAVDAVPAEEAAMWALSQAIRDIPEPADQPGPEGVVGVIAATDFLARQVVRATAPGRAGSSPPGRPGSPGRAVTMRWETSS